MDVTGFEPAANNDRVITSVIDTHGKPAPVDTRCRASNNYKTTLCGRNIDLKNLRNRTCSKIYAVIDFTRPPQV